MVTYRYRCSGCGSFDLALPMGQAAPERPCAECGGAARRVFTAPALGRAGSPLSRARAAQEASAHEPRVVTRSAEPRRPAPPSDPRHAKLPRP
ncbi:MULTISPECIES: FmdB family zinc ribbon protein [Actinomadura]|uniref:Zinc ribbon domain-containing protein n=1 Tax=Actinomadura litoris TaxID=2678616 RepID=A0A7K1LBH7_9ACTN|nr:MULTISPECIES: FmdB family zinc ribbon protein [Actinomadura]MBT2209769.1 transcriptional regulator [Actinomadura sp. NEAU-AAG7]MUN41774.1 zinc ribbon domain-containing protein [Actinomadura litoris]